MPPAGMGTCIVHAGISLHPAAGTQLPGDGRGMAQR